MLSKDSLLFVFIIILDVFVLSLFLMLILSNVLRHTTYDLLSLH